MAVAAPVAPAAAAAAPARPAINQVTRVRWVMVPVTQPTPMANFQAELASAEYQQRRCVRWTGPKKSGSSYSTPVVGENFLWVTDYTTNNGVYVGQILGNAAPRQNWGANFRNPLLHDTFQIRVWATMSWADYVQAMGYNVAYKLRGTIRSATRRRVAMIDPRLNITLIP